MDQVLTPERSRPGRLRRRAPFCTGSARATWTTNWPSRVGARRVFNYGDAPNGGMAGTHLNGSIIAATEF